MARERKPKQLTHSERHQLHPDVESAIIEAVWQCEPCAAGTGARSAGRNHSWAYSTVKTTMDRMVAKGLLATHSIRNLQMFTSLVSRDDAKRIELRRTFAAPSTRR